MSAGYSGTPLPKKLGLKPGQRVTVVGAPAPYETMVQPLPDVTLIGPRGRVDVAHLFVTRQADLARRVPGLRKRIAPNGMLWVSWPKRASGMATDVTEDVIRAVAFQHQLVDVKVCAVDETWSGLKLVIRKAAR